MIFYEKTNFLSEDEFDYWNRFHNSRAVPWHFLAKSAYDDPGHMDESSWDFSFGLTALWEGKAQNSVGDKARNLLEKICAEFAIPVNGIFRIRLGLITKTPFHHIHEPHIDLEFPHLTCLYYISTTNGNTILYDKFWREGDKPYLNSYKELQQIKEIKCEANKLVVFDGTQYHSAVSQTDKRQRIVINFNFENTLKNL